MSEIEELKSLVFQTVPEKGLRSEDLPNNEEDLLEWISKHIEQLIQHDFEALLLLLYRIDVNEQKVRKMLSDTGGQNAARTIASLILERQKQKLKWREHFRKFPTQLETEDDERW